jgi:hypothetical protein
MAKVARKNDNVREDRRDLGDSSYTYTLRRIQQVDWFRLLECMQMILSAVKTVTYIHEVECMRHLLTADLLNNVLKELASL